MGGDNNKSIRQEKLSDEILESEKARSDLLRWKLVICAVLGAAGLGLKTDINTTYFGLLALIPLTWVYIDLLCTNINLRIIIIGRFFVTQKDRYELFIRPRRIAFCLEDWALYGSTYMISGLLMLLSILNFFIKLFDEDLKFSLIFMEYIIVFMSSVVGITLTRWTQEAYKILLGIKHLDKNIDAEEYLIEQLSEKNLRFKWFLPIAKRFLNGIAGSGKPRETILNFFQDAYRREDITRLQAFLEAGGTFRFHCLDNGLFPAVSAMAAEDVSGYQYVWIRDNVHIAHAHYAWGDIPAASRTAKALMLFMQSQRGRMQKIIQDPAMAEEPMNRPHVRFDADNIQELDQPWPHAQNDALGYFLWFYCKLAKERRVPLDTLEKECLIDLIRYLQAIRYWSDRDSGHWEEVRKVSASSIGTVIAGLREFALLWEDQESWPPSCKTSCGIDERCIAELLAKGEAALQKILPYESTGPEKETQRRYDAALLFLIYPLQVVSSDLASQILQDVKNNLEGAIGIRRYLHDSYWCADYRSLFSAETRTGDFSENMQSRDAYINPGEEAQWCMFDSIISCIYGLRVAAGQAESESRRLQVHYLNRALKQLVPDPNGSGTLLCPEAYFLENGAYVPNDHIPLQWAQANLKLALHWMSITAP